MADTGAPWNIPYAEPADLVRDWPALSEDVADAVAAGLSAAGPAGIGSNVVQVEKTNTFSTASTSYVDITGLSVVITPSSATSKVLVLGRVMMGGTDAGFGAAVFRLLRGSTVIYQGNADGAKERGLGSVWGQERFPIPSPIAFLDSPGVSTATTYKVQMRVNAGTGQMNRSINEEDDGRYVRVASSLVVVEVAV